MKFFLARGGCCAKDVTEEVRAIREAGGSADGGAGFFDRIPEAQAGDTLVAAPDMVFEGWGIGSDGSCLAPRPPSGWACDERTGTFYRLGDGGAGMADLASPEEERNTQSGNPSERKGQEC